MSTWRRSLATTVESRTAQFAVMGVIVVNAVVLGLQTTDWGRRDAPATWLAAVDVACLTVFVVELALKMVAHGRGFFRSGWNVFDLAVVSIALVPASEGLAVLRALRALRILRLISAAPQLRFVVGALGSAIPGMASIGALLMLIFYVGAVMATTMFGGTFPEWFGSLGGSAYSLFQIMTLESWSMGIVRPVMEVHPWAWAFFVPFILVSAFTVLNLFIAVIVDSMTQLRAHGTQEEPVVEATLNDVQASVAALERQVAELTRALRTERESRREVDLDPDAGPTS